MSFSVIISGRLDEELDRSQLLAILKAETLLDLKAREVSAVDVLFRLDYEAEGYEIVIGVKPRIANAAGKA